MTISSHNISVSDSNSKFRRVLKSVPAVFDTSHYKAQLHPCSWGRFFPIEHYIFSGRFSGVSPASSVDVKYCADRYSIPEPEVLRYYLLHGRDKGWYTRPFTALTLHEETRAFLEQEEYKHSSECAVCLHLFHYDLWPYFAKKLSKLDVAFDLFVNLIEHSGGAEEIINEIKSAFPGAVINRFPNHGRDILPFVQLVQAGVLSDYNTVIKLHTKKSNAAMSWRERLVDSLIGDTEQFETVNSHLRSNKAGLVGSSKDMYSGQTCWHHNAEGVRALCRELKVDESLVDSFPDFLGGSIFAIDGNLLDRMRHLNVTPCDWPPEAGQTDGTLGHQIERLFSIVAYSAGLKVVGLDYPETK